MAKKRTTSVAVLATIFVLAATAFVFIFMTASADLALPDQPTNLPNTFADGGRAFGRIWDILMLAGGIIFMVLLLVGGLQYLTSGGDDGTATKAKNLLRDAVIGLVIMVLAWPIGVAVLTQFGLHTGQLITIGGQSFSLPNATSNEGNLDTGIDLGTGNQSGSSGGGGGSTQNPENTVRQVIISASPADAGEAIVALPLDEGGQSDTKIVGPTGATSFNLAPGRYRITIGGVEAGVRTISPQDGSTLNWTFERIGAETSRAISFTLFEESNQPLPNTQIQIFKRTDVGEERIGTFTSDTNGRVDIDLPQGQTFIIKDSVGTTLAEQQIPNTDGFVIPIIFSNGVPL